MTESARRSPRCTAVAGGGERAKRLRARFEEQPIGGSAIDAAGEPLRQHIGRCKAADAVLLAAIGSPRFDNLPRDKRPETGLLGLRSGMDLFANLRPVKIVPALIDASSLKREVIDGVDLMVVRELTGGIYFDSPRGALKLTVTNAGSTP